MGKRNKKSNQYSQQKLIKAQHRNEFFRKLKYICDIAECPDVYNLIPVKELERLYLMRCQAVRIKAGQGQEVPAAILNDSKKIISALLKQVFVPLIEGGGEVSLNDYFTAGLTWLTYYDRLKDSDFTNAAKVKSLLAPFRENTIGFERAGNYLSGTMHTISMVNSDYDDLLYWLKLEMRAEMNVLPSICFEMDIYCAQPEKKHLIIDGSNRPVIRIGWGISEPEIYIEWIGIRASQLNIENGEHEKKYPVYIQSHVLLRLDERIDCVDHGMLHFNIYQSLKEPNISIDRNGNFLFEYRLFDKKVGYLLGSMIDEHIVIRTFLFLTNFGTPEGDRLRKNTGLGKEDMKYLDFDKLSTFVHSDIRDNDRVKEIFMKAGCGNLFDVDDRTIHNEETTKKRSSADLIAMYLGLKI